MSLIFQKGACVHARNEYGGSHPSDVSQNAAPAPTITSPDPLAPRSSLPADRALALDQLTHFALERLEQPDLLRHLLTRLQEVMDADNAAVLLAEEDDAVLTIYTVAGPEEAVAQQVRVPVGQGVAGSIYATRTPLVIDDLTKVPVANPFLREHLRSLVGVPLIARGRALGALHVDSVRVKHFSDADVPFLQAIGERIALALDHARVHQMAQSARLEAEAHTRQLDAIFQAMADAVFVVDRDGRVLKVNAAARELLGLDEADDSHRSLDDLLGGREVLDVDGSLMTPDKWPSNRILRGEALTGADIVDVVLRSPDGERVELSVSGAPIRDEHGEIVASVSICRDVTGRRQLERRTRESLDALLHMAQMLVALPTELPAGEVEAAHTPTSVADTRAPQDAHFELARRLALLTKGILGCTRVSIMAVEPQSERLRSIAVVGLSPQHEAKWWKEQRQREANGVYLENFADAEHVARLREGDIFAIDVTQAPYASLPLAYGVMMSLIAPMRTGSELIGILSLDFGSRPHAFTAEEIALAGAVAQLGAVILERDRLLRERAQAEAGLLALQAAQRQMDSFLGVAGHELKTPLATTVASSQLAQRRLKTLTQAIRSLDASAVEKLEPLIEPLTRLVDRIEDAAHRQNRLVNDLLDVSRIQSGRLELETQPLDLRQLVSDAVEEQRLLNPSRDLSLHLPRKTVPVIADSDRIGQAVTNLLTNALKYSPPEAPVDVWVEVNERSAKVRVHDQGLGIAPEEQASVWERFHRAPGVEVLSGAGVGLGLGLYITFEIIERHGGEVGLTSAPGKGSTFWFSLPLAPGD